MRPPAPSTIPADDDDGADAVDVDHVDARDGKEVVTLYDLPELFCRGEDDQDAPTTRRISTVFVQRKHPSTKELAYIDWKPVEQLSTVQDLLDMFGPGTYRVQGRADDRKTVIKQIFHTVGDAEPEVLGLRRRGELERTAAAPRLDITQLAAAVTAIATPILGVLGGLMDRRDAARREERERDEKRQEMFMTTMTQLMTARNSDLESMLRAAQRPSSANTPAEAYQEGQAATLELIRAVKEEGLGGEDAETKILSLLESLAAGAKKGEGDAAAAGAGANGTGAS